MFFAFSQNSFFSNRAWYSLQVRLENHLKVEEMTSKFILPIHFKIYDFACWKNEAFW